MIVDDNNNNIHIKILESLKTPRSGLRQLAAAHEPKANLNEKDISKKKIEPTQIETKNILENVLPLTEKQRAEVELFKKLINS